jgi:hypothetical protein
LNRLYVSLVGGNFSNMKFSNAAIEVCMQLRIPTECLKNRRDGVRILAQGKRV